MKVLSKKGSRKRPKDFFLCVCFLKRLKKKNFNFFIQKKNGTLCSSV